MKTEEDLPLLLRVSEVARLLSISRSKGYEMIAAGQIPGVVRIGRSVQVSSGALLRWIGELESEFGGSGTQESPAPTRPHASLKSSAS